MLLQNRQMSFKIPHTSTCILCWSGRIYNGDIINIESPLFNSISYNEGPISNHQQFSVPVKIMNGSEYVDVEDGSEGTLVCDDNDIFHMYVRFT